VNSSNYDEYDSAAMDTMEPQESTMPIIAGEGGEFGELGAADPLAGASIQKRFNTGSMIIVLVLVLAVVGLFCMHTLAKVTAGVVGVSEYEELVDSYFEKANSEERLADGATNKDVLKVISETYTEHQVPLANVAKNPFRIELPELEQPVVVAANTSDPDNIDRKYKQMQEDLKMRMDSAASDLRITSILFGSDPIAVVNGTVVRQGDVVTAGLDEIEFTVLRIDATSVTVQASSEYPEVTVLEVVELQR
jgi:hypothetical protein